MAKYILNGLTWSCYYGATPEYLGYLPEIILASDLRPVREQIKERYSHGVGWKPFTRFQVNLGMDSRAVLQYPGDPPILMSCECKHPNGETIQLFEGSWLRVIQPDGSYEISRVN